MFSPRRNLERVKLKATEAARGMEHAGYKEQSVALGVYSLAQRRLREVLIVAYNYFKGSYKDDKANFFLGSRRWYIKGREPQIAAWKVQFGTLGN